MSCVKCKFDQECYWHPNSVVQRNVILNEFGWISTQQDKRVYIFMPCLTAGVDLNAVIMAG